MTSLKPPPSVSEIESGSIFQPPPFGVARVHAVEIGGEQRGLVAAGAGADLEDHVLLVVGILRSQQDPELVLERRDRRIEARDLGARELAHVGIVVVEHALRVGELLEAAR